jgi:hypothetical protein
MENELKLTNIDIYATDFFTKLINTKLVSDYEITRLHGFIFDGSRTFESTKKLVFYIFDNIAKNNKIIDIFDGYTESEKLSITSSAMSFTKKTEMINHILQIIDINTMIRSLKDFDFSNFVETKVVPQKEYDFKTEITFFSKDSLRVSNYIYDKTGFVVGSFARKDMPTDDYALIKLDDFDKNYVKDVPLKVGQQIFRCQNARMKNRSNGEHNPSGVEIIIKIDLNTEMMYYLENYDEDNLIFERKGYKLSYLKMLDSAFTNR